MVIMELDELLSNGSKIVSKFGTNSLTKGNGTWLNPNTIWNIGAYTHTLYLMGKLPSHVISGAVPAGMQLNNIYERPSSPAELQALSAEGARYLWTLFAAAHAEYHITTIYVPVTHHSFQTEEEKDNIKGLIERSWKDQKITLWNTNDALTSEELARVVGDAEHFYDNDPLAAMLATCIGADTLIFFSDEGYMGTGGGVSKTAAIEKAEAMGIRVGVYSIDALTTFK